MLVVNVTLEPNIYPQTDSPLQQRRFRRISASAVRASEKRSVIANRKSTFQLALVEVRTLPLTLPKGGQKRICRLKTDSLVYP